MASTSHNTLFSPGRTFITPGVIEWIWLSGFDPLAFLRRHLCGDWGDALPSKQRQNDAALKSGEGRLFSIYQVAPRRALWIITDSDRILTTLMLPSEY